MSAELRHIRIDVVQISPSELLGAKGKAGARAKRHKGGAAAKGIEGEYRQVGHTAIRLILKNGRYLWGAPDIHDHGTYTAERQDDFSCIIKFRSKAFNMLKECCVTRRGRTYTLTELPKGGETKFKLKQGKLFLSEMRAGAGKPLSITPRGEAAPAWKKVEPSTAAVTFYLPAESLIVASAIPARPSSKTPTVIRVTHSNEYGRVDSDVFVRPGDPSRPLGERDLDAVSDWRQAKLVEELLWNDRRQAWVLRSKAKGATSVWSGTYEASIQLPTGRQQIELKIVSRVQAVPSVVLSNWKIYVR